MSSHNRIQGILQQGRKVTRRKPEPVLSKVITEAAKDYTSLRDTLALHVPEERCREYCFHFEHFQKNLQKAANIIDRSRLHHMLRRESEEALRGNEKWMYSLYAIRGAAEGMHRLISEKIPEDNIHAPSYLSALDRVIDTINIYLDTLPLPEHSTGKIQK